MASPSSIASSSSKEIKKHHQKGDICYKRACYRESRWERAVKVYTINQESKYLMVTGVPAVGATKELLERFALYGDIEEYRHLDEYPVEEFTEAYWIKYRRIPSARFGKKKMDNRSFFGGLLHVFYAPEYENEDDTREKLMERKRSVLRKCKEYFGSDKEKQSEKGRATSSVAESKLQTPPPPPIPTIGHHSSCSSSTESTSNKSSSIFSQSFKTVSQYPHIPTKQATLPVEMQHLSTEQVYPNQETSLTLQEKEKEIVREGSNKKIVWNKNAPPKPFSHLHQYTQEPGAWNLYPSAARPAPKNEELTQTDIRKKLMQTAEQNKVDIQIPEISPLDMIHSNETPATDLPPPKKKRPNDGRKRI